jgi:hypothetical protein
MRLQRAALCCLLALSLVAFAWPAQAADQDKPAAPAAPSAATQAQELVKLLGMDQFMRHLSSEAVLPLVRQVMASNADFNDKELDLMSSAWQETVWHDTNAELISAAAKVYARHLNAEEITQALNFFKSPVGRKLVTSQPLITGECRQAAQEVVKAWLDRINADPKKREDFFKRVAEKLPPEVRKKTGNP